MWKLKIAEGGPVLVSLNNFVGRQHWEFDPDVGTPEERAEVQRVREEFKKNRFRTKQSADLLMRMQLRKENPCGPIPPPVQLKETEVITKEAVITTLRRALTFYSSIQAHDGHWPAESAGPRFFLQPFVMALYIIGALNAIFSPSHQQEIIRYLYNHQNEDGGWGFHIEGHNTIFGSALSYIALRILREGPEDGEDKAMARGRKWILDHGGLVAIPSWGKFWVTVLGLYEWFGCNPLPPEFWLLPQIFPIHPGKMLCYCRLVYMPMSYLYGKRFVGPITELIQSLRQELYNKPYHQINWNKAQNTVAKDLYYPHPLIQDMLWGFLHHVVEPLLSRWPFSLSREKALKAAIDHVHYEDKNTRYVSIGSVEKVLCLIASWAKDPNGEAYKLHVARIPDNYWVAEDGLKIQSFGSQTWDACFTIQAILSCNLNEEYGPTLRKSHDFMKASQVLENPSGDFKAMYRHTSKGAWTFSMQDHGWQVSDGIAEGLKVALLFSKMSPDLVGEKIKTGTQLSRNGGFPAWEPQRAFGWLEKFNPTDFFEDTLIEREYVECNSSAVQGLALFRTLYPKHRICYTYGTWFDVGGLAACGKNYKNCPALRKACEFLLSNQNKVHKQLVFQFECGLHKNKRKEKENEGEVWTNIEGNRANLVQTAWAVLSLIEAGQAGIDPTPIHHGVRVLINSQMEDGDFPQQEITGVFLRNCTLNYSSYINIFPIWALGEYRKQVLFAYPNAQASKR
ncbi:hypothetical protein I3842_02G053100 [Carya illinoinensis]|uniref:Terpene cyclase/mutase family member n=1 Tax=Carya illinoinensis TaxID=32201 RepID=A0A922FP57_CARIL|nr:hypothetical protein I3842_02G053100 [Carya illinoinensis]